MPKELAHWHIADRVASTLLERNGAVDAANGSSRGTSLSSHESSTLARVVSAIQRGREPYLVGAIAFDSPFYALDFAHRELFTRTADELHGVHGDATLDRFRANFASIEADPTDTRIAFLAGALTHYAADVTIHPLVNYFCNGSPLASQRHRAFETCLDLYVTETHRRPEECGHGMRGLLAACDREELARAAMAFYWPEEEPKPIDPMRVFSRHAFVRDRFERPGWQRFSHVLGRFGGALRVIAATFYPTEKRARSISPDLEQFFGSEIEYLHPRTGEHYNRSIDQCIGAAVSYATELIVSFAVSPPEDPGFSLDAGCDVMMYPAERHHWTPREACGDTAFGVFPYYCR